MAISNHRLVSLENGQVTFRWKNYAQGNRQETMTLSAAEFLRRFFLHLLPTSFEASAGDFQRSMSPRELEQHIAALRSITEGVSHYPGAYRVEVHSGPKSECLLIVMPGTTCLDIVAEQRGIVAGIFLNTPEAADLDDARAVCASIDISDDPIAQALIEDPSN